LGFCFDGFMVVLLHGLYFTGSAFTRFCLGRPCSHGRWILVPPVGSWFWQSRCWDGM
jgi:hypothetical protein